MEEKTSFSSKESRRSSPSKKMSHSEESQGSVGMPYRFEAMWMLDPQYEQIIKQAWDTKLTGGLKSFRGT